MNFGPIEPQELPWDIHEAVAEVKMAEQLCPGVYYAATFEMVYGGTEFYLVDQDTDTIPQAAKAYGQSIEGVPGCLLYPFEHNAEGRRIIEYETQRFHMKTHPSEEARRKLREAAAYGMEQCPQYFGPFPPPVDTPLGHVIRCKALINGVFWEETDAAKAIIAVAYPRWLDVFSAYVMRYAVRVGRDADGNTDTAFESLCFQEESMPIVLFELQRYYGELRHSPYIDNQALMNVVYRDFFDYAVSFNTLEQSGADDMLRLLIDDKEVDKQPQGSVDKVIRITPDAGYAYLRI